MATRRSIVKGRVVEVDICEREVGFVLSVGPVSLWLAPDVAVDVLETLARAVAQEQLQEQEQEQRDHRRRSPPSPPAAMRRRSFS